MGGWGWEGPRLGRGMRRRQAAGAHGPHGKGMPAGFPYHYPFARPTMRQWHQKRPGWAQPMPVHPE